MSLEKDIEALFITYGANLEKEFKAQLEAALKLGSKGGRSGQESRITFTATNPTFKNGIISMQILASEEYWYYIDKGRKPGKMPPPDKLGAKWQSANNIDARKVIAEINAKYKKNGLNVSKKGLNYNSAAKQLSFIIARSIGLKGYKARPFVEKAINSGWREQFEKDLSELIGRNITIELTTK